MIKAVVLSLSLAVLSFCAAQAQKEAIPDSVSYRSVLIIPFDTKFYLSDIDKEMLEGSGISSNELVKLYRDQIGTYIARKLTGKYKISYLQAPAVSDTIDDYSFTYSSIKYSYEPLPDLKQKTRSLFSGKEENPKGRPVIDPLGDSTPNKGRRHMVAGIKNRDLLGHLNKKYNADYLFFITQLETRTDVSDPAALGADRNRRIIRVHCTVLDRNGEKVCSDLAEEFFMASQNKVNEVIEQKFPALAEKASACMPGGAPIKIKKDN